ncbi:hypothetical protein m02_10460, partial [Bartonella bovis m02]
GNDSADLIKARGKGSKLCFFSFVSFFLFMFFDDLMCRCFVRCFDFIV